MYLKINSIDYRFNLVFIPSVNLASNSLFPIALAAQHICRRSSSSRRIQRTIDPKQ